MSIGHSGPLAIFPTYTLGNLYAAMLFHQAKKDMADLEQNIGQGNFLPLKNWLNDRVHQWGGSIRPRNSYNE